MVNFNFRLMRSMRLEPFLATERVTAIDKQIALKIEGFEYDAEEVSRQREGNRVQIQKLQRALKRAEERDIPVLEKRTINEIRSYEKTLRRQLQDILKIITWLREIIEDEYLQVIYDVRQPLTVFEKFIKELKPFFSKIKLTTEMRNQVKEIMDSIAREYENLIDLTMNFVEKNFSFFSKLGVNFEKTSLKLRSDYGLTIQLRQRAKLKQQINGKTQWILSQLERLEDVFRDLKRAHSFDAERVTEIVKNIAYFRKQFEELVRFCISRAEASGHMISEAITIQQNKVKELDDIRAKLKKFYDEFLENQLRESVEHTSETKRMFASKRLSEFGKYQEEVKRELEGFEREFDRQLLKAKKRDLSQLRIEKRELRRTINRLGRVRRVVRKTIHAGMLSLTLMGSLGAAGAKMNEPYLTTKQAVETTVRQFRNIMNPDVVRNLLAFRNNPEVVEEINKKNMELNEQADQRDLTREEIEFVRAQLRSFGVGGFVRGFGPAPLLISRYADNAGGVIELPGRIYQESRAVQYVQTILTQKVIEHVKNGESSGTTRSTDQGVITEKRVFETEEGEHDGQVNEDGILVSPTGSKLHYADNRYPLYAHFEVRGDMIHIRFEIPTQTYDYKDSPPGAYSEINTPSGATLKIPDHLLAVLEQRGEFTPTDYTTHWDIDVNVSSLSTDFVAE